MIVAVVVVIIVLIFSFAVFFGAPYVPTRKKWIDDALDLAGVSASDFVVDLGSGDGAVLKRVASCGARSLGYEINPILVGVSRFRLRHVNKLARVKLANFWHMDLPVHTTVIYVFMESRDIRKLAGYLHEQAIRISERGGVSHLRIISFGFEIPGMKLVKRTTAMNLYNISAQR